MFGNTDRTDAGTATAVRDAKSLVQIQMANVRAIIAGAAKTDLRVHVCAVHVNLPAVRVHDLANLPDSCFENAVRARISHHERGQIARVFIRFPPKIGQIDIAIFQGRNRNNAEARHDRAGRIRSMCRLRNQTNVAMPFVVRGVVFADRKKSGVLAL